MICERLIFVALDIQYCFHDGSLERPWNARVRSWNQFLKVGTRVGFGKFRYQLLLNYDRAWSRPGVQDFVRAAVGDEGIWWGMGWEEGVKQGL